MFGDFLRGLPLLLNLALFSIAAAAVWLAGTRLAHLADAISDKMRIGRAFMGLVFLAAATELPEAVTTITAALENEAHLLLNNMFGGITMQTAIMAVADAAVPMTTLTLYPRKPTHTLEGILLILLLAFLLSVTVLGERLVLWNIGLGSVVMIFCYAGSIWLLRNYDRETVWIPVEIPEEIKAPLGTRTARDLDALSLPSLLRTSTFMAAIILICGVMLVSLAEVVADQSGLGRSFIGVTLLAASTSLPELSTTIAAVRMGAFTMAISNIFGSNLIMVALLFPADILYRGGVLLGEIDVTASFALISGIVVTGIYITGLLLRQKNGFSEWGSIPWPYSVFIC